MSIEGSAFNDGSRTVIAACIEVHRHLGPGLLEAVYERCLARELSLRGIPFERQVGAALFPSSRLPVLLRYSYGAAES
jgi:GxxExxY protein